MPKDFGLILIEARQSANLTQEKASELLDIAPRTLCKYECNVTRPPDDKILKMMAVYKNELIGYYWLRTSQVGKKLLPAIDDTCLAEDGLCFLNGINKATECKNDLIDICLDNQIDEAEQTRFHSLLDKTKILVKAFLSLRFYKNKKAVPINSTANK